MKINRRKFSAALLPALMGGAPASFAQAVRPGGGEILIGQTLPLTGPVGQLGADFHSGFQAALAQANQRGGIGGRLVKLMTLDDGYVVARTLANAEKVCCCCPAASAPRTCWP
jgi:branched-chain amino acid transport system substrate-binding protein